MSEGTPAGRKNLSSELTRLIATARNDITIPRYSTVLSPLDETLLQKGSGKGLKLYDEVARDGRVFSALQKRGGQIVARAWEVEPASESAVDEAAAAGVEKLLDTIAFDRLTLDLFGAVLKGFAVVEIVWERRGAEIFPAKLVAHDQRRFTFGEDWRPRLLTFEKMIEGAALPERKFIIHRVGATGNNPYGLGLGSILFWHVMFKREGVAFWMKYLEKFAQPTPFAKYPEGLSIESQNILLDRLVRLAQDGAIVVPLGTELDLLEASRAGEAGYEKWCRYWDEQTAEVVLGETLTTNVGSVGSKAAADTHMGVLELLVDGDADLISQTLNETLIRWYCEFNHPQATPPTAWRPRPENEAEIEDLATKRAGRRKAEIEALDAAEKRGFRPKDEQTHVEELFDIEMEEVDPPAPPPIPLPGAVPPRPGAMPDPASQDPEEEDPPAFAEENDAIGGLAEQLAHFAGGETGAWIDRIRARLGEIEAEGGTLEDVPGALLALYPELSIDPLGRIVGDALALAELTGRADVIDETGIAPTGSKKNTEDGATVADGATFAEDDARPGFQPFKEAIAFHRQKVRLPTRGWRDTLHGAHDRAFVVAGAAKDDLLADLQGAVDRAIAEGETLADFRKRFDKIVAKHGWDYRGGRDWRTRVIYDTNMRTAHQAGRLKQMRSPAVVKMRPFWQYVHAMIRVPKNPRDSHVALDGKVFLHDDPIWEKIYPPNGWMDTCGVRTLSRHDMRRLGKDGPDTAPTAAEVEKAVPAEWRYAPGDTWERGLVPPELQRPLTSQMELPLDALPPLADLAKPVKAGRLADGLGAEDYAAAFLEHFGAAIGRGMLFRDKAGTRLVISDHLFKRKDGRWKIDPTRGPEMARLAEAIADPDEIWVDFARPEQGGAATLVRRYLRYDPAINGYAVFNWSGAGWEGATVFNPTKGAANKPDPGYLDRWRKGALIYRRAKK